MKTILTVLFGSLLAYGFMHVEELEHYLARSAALGMTTEQRAQSVGLELHQAFCAHGQIAICK